MEAEICIFYFIWLLSTYSVRELHFSPPKYFFTCKILVTKYSQNKYGGPMEGEIRIFYPIWLFRYETRKQYLFSTRVTFFPS